MTDIKPKEKSTRNCFHCKVYCGKVYCARGHFKNNLNLEMVLKRANLYAPCLKCTEGDWTWE